MKKWISLGLVLVLLLTVAACGAKEAEKTEEMTLRLGVMSAVDMLPIFIANENGYFEEEGLTVDLQVFKSFKDRDAALQAGALDGIIGDLVAIAIYQNAGVDMVVTGATDGEFELVVGEASPVETIADFSGEKVAISENTVIEYTIDQLLEANGKTPADIEKVVIPPLPTRLEMLNAGEVDASLMPNPFSDAAVAAGGKVIESVTSEKGGYISVTAFLGDVVSDNPEALKAFYRGYNKGVDYLNENPIADYEDSVIAAVGYPESMKGQTAVPTFRKNQLPERELVEKVFAWATDKGLLTTELNLDDVLSDVGVID